MLQLRKQEEAKREAEWLAIANGIAKSIAHTDQEIMRKQRFVQYVYPSDLCID